MAQTSAPLNKVRLTDREIPVDTRAVRGIGAVALFATFTWLAIALTHDRHHLDWDSSGRLAWSLTVLMAVAIIARGIFLARPVTGGHAALAGVAAVGGLTLHVLFSALLGDVVIVFAALVLMWPTQARPEPDALPEVWRLVDATRGDALAPFAMHSLKSYHFSATGRAVLAYRTRMGFAVVSGDLLGDEAEFEPLVASFATLCRSRGWRIVVLACSERWLNLWLVNAITGQRLRAVPFGRDVVINVASFATAGRAKRNLRQAVRRTHNAGVTTEVIAEQNLTATQRGELTEVLCSSHWKARTERGFSMILDGALQGRYPGVQIIVARDREGQVLGFQRYATAGGGNDVSLDMPWRRPGAPNGLDERLSADMIEWSKYHGARRVSLAFAAFPEIFDEQHRGPIQSVLYRLIHLGDGLIRLESLYRYLRKYHALDGRRYAIVSMRHLVPALFVMLTLEFMPRPRHLLRRPQDAR